ncbi:hypothetical protein [Pseudanabaena mucicola]|uniref:DUF2281 domain-containing protein n=1 Tax=Pseudanabaena mucicola FACHB-723 TaxID=2692860 RepID=A0ABR7ZY51_9CYAN|nr:hypothetical protein [Pseudanabaena mucicola]MBD2188323.1 hypothetical protein [Pseudanabaena mucicola FACHB-723]
MNSIQIRNQAKQYIDALSPESLKFVNDFLIYLVTQEAIRNTANQIDKIENDAELSALELAGDLVGCLEAASDLSTNKEYFQGFGE